MLLNYSLNEEIELSQCNWICTREQCSIWVVHKTLLLSWETWSGKKQYLKTSYERSDSARCSEFLSVRKTRTSREESCIDVMPRTDKISPSMSISRVSVGSVIMKNTADATVKFRLHANMILYCFTTGPGSVQIVRAILENWKIFT